MPRNKPDSRERDRLRQVLRLLEETYGAETWHWDPEHVRGPMDVLAGAILVQHTTWTNAERALQQLRDAGALDPATLLALPDGDLVKLIRVSGTPTIKLRRLRAIATTIVDSGGIDALLHLPAEELRRRLLATHGVGPETADGILLYAAGQRTFLIDAYTQRLFGRIGLGPRGAPYSEWQRWFEDRLTTASVRDFQRYHAHIVLHGKAICRASPRCPICPIVDRCEFGSRLVSS